MSASNIKTIVQNIETKMVNAEDAYSFPVTVVKSSRWFDLENEPNSHNQNTFLVDVPSGEIADYNTDFNAYVFKYVDLYIRYTKELHISSARDGRLDAQNDLHKIINFFVKKSNWPVDSDGKILVYAMLYIRHDSKYIHNNKDILTEIQFQLKIRDAL